MSNYRPKPVPHRELSRRAADLNSVVDDAIDALEIATRRERMLTDGEADRRTDIAAIYPSLKENL